MSESYDEQRRFQRIPRQKPRPARDRADQALNQQAQCMRIPRNVVREARELHAEEEDFNPIGAIRTFVTNLLR